MRAATDNLSVQMRALADPTRRNIVTLLAKELNAQQLEVRLKEPLAQPTVSHHLRMLFKAGFVTRRRAGTYTYYSRREQVVEAVIAKLAKIVK